MDFTHFFLLMMAGNLLQSYCMILLADTSIILLMYCLFIFFSCAICFSPCLPACLYLQGCGLSRDVLVTRRTNVSSRTKSLTSRSCLGLGLMRLGSRLGLGAICLGLGPVCLVSGLGPLRLLETFCAVARSAYCTAVRAILTSMTFAAHTYSFTVFLLFYLLIYHKAELCHVSFFFVIY